MRNCELANERAISSRLRLNRLPPMSVKIIAAYTNESGLQSFISENSTAIAAGDKSDFSLFHIKT